jgi:hypothetical protein
VSDANGYRRHECTVGGAKGAPLSMADYLAGETTAGMGAFRRERA